MNTLRGPARGLKFWCARKRQPRRVMCSPHQLKATKAKSRTFKLTTTPDHHGAGLPRKCSRLRQSRRRLAARVPLERSRVAHPYLPFMQKGWHCFGRAPTWSEGCLSLASYPSIFYQRPTNGAARPTLCAYHTDRLRAGCPHGGARGPCRRTSRRETVGR